MAALKLGRGSLQRGGGGASRLAALRPVQMCQAEQPTGLRARTVLSRAPRRTRAHARARARRHTHTHTHTHNHAHTHTTTHTHLHPCAARHRTARQLAAMHCPTRDGPTTCCVQRGVQRTGLQHARDFAQVATYKVATCARFSCRLALVDGVLCESALPRHFCSAACNPLRAAPHLHRDSAHCCHIFTGTGLTPAHN